MDGLTERQKQVLQVFRDHQAIHGHPPTFREVGAAIGVGSTNGVNDHFRALERKGYLVRRSMKARGWTLARSACPHCGGAL